MIDFDNFTSDGNLVYIPASGVPFSWTNGHKDNSVVFERLDREKVHLHNLAIFGSDVSPIIVQCNNIGYKRKNSFKFEAMWLNHYEFNQFVIGNVA